MIEHQEIHHGAETQRNCPDCQEKLRKSAPLDSCSLFSVLIMRFMSPLMSLGYKNPLTMDDIPLLPTEDDLANARDRFLRNLAAARAKGDESTVFCLIKTFWPRWLRAAIVLFFSGFASLANPFIITDFVRSIKENCHNLTHGLLDALGLFLAGTVSSLLVNNAYYNNVRVAGVVREALMAAIYSKSLLLSSSAKTPTTTGETVNLMSADTQRVYESVLYVHYIWLSPLIVITVCGVLVYEVGLAALYGIVVLLALVPLQWLGTVLATRYRRAMLRHTDHRIMFTSEMLTGIRIIKQYAWEKPVSEKVSQIRAQEIADLWKLLIVNNISVALFNVWPGIVTAVIFIGYVLEGHTLTPSIVFMIMALLVAIRFPISMIQKAFQVGTDALVSLRRIGVFLALPEMDYTGRTTDTDAPGTIIIRNASFSYDPSSQAPVLRNINLNVQPGTSVAVIGPVASGKSSLLSAILGEIQTVSGSISVSGSTAYTSQHHWIRNKTVRENIIFGKEFEENKYNAVLAASALIQDLNILPAGDLTEIGEQGINLSGGQKARIMFARACYADADIALLDDPFSAVDVNTGNIMFQYGIRGLLSRTTRVITLNSHLHFLNNVDLIVYFRLPEGEGDTIVEIYDCYQNFTECHPNFEFAEGKPAEEANITVAMKQSIVKEILVEKEMEQIGTVRPRVYLDYLKQCSVFGAVFSGLIILLSFLIGQLIRVGSDLVSGFWSQMLHPDQNWWILLQSTITAAALVTFVIRSFIFNNMTVRAGRLLHDTLFERIVRAPVPIFYDITPIGRVVNRFSKDMDQIDVSISDFLGQLLLYGLTLVISVLLSCYALPWFILPLVPIMAFFYWIQRYFRYSSRQLKRIEGTSRSPIFSKFEETLTGLATIRAHRKQLEFTHEAEHTIERNSQALLANQLAGRWLALRLDLVSNLVIAGVAVAIASISCSVDLAIAIVALVQVTQLTGMLQWTVRVSTEVENNMTAVERVLEYTDVAPEAPSTTPNDPDESWPNKGEIVLRNLRARYRPELPLVLKGINAHIKSMEKVGICGRTGSGKSSLLLCLLRMIERDPSGGPIIIDDVPTDTIGLHCLRSRISVIPQDAVLFSGTIRQNLDPFNERTDEEITESLRHVYFISDRSSVSLDDMVAERGSNFSFGQRQLICIARAFLRRSKIIICDEATSGIDSKTDELIQAAIRSLFKRQTVITVAHRLETIADSDRIMVIREGIVEEFDTPQNLIDNPNGYFRQMVESVGESAVERFKAITKKNIFTNHAD